MAQKSKSLPRGTRLMRRPEVEEKTGLGRSSIYALMAQNLFPKPVDLGLRRVGWVSYEIDAWIMQRINSRTEEELKCPESP